MSFVLARRRVDVLLPTAAAGALAALLVWLGPPGTDLAAHVYQRALYLQHGFLLWNNFWYAGRYSFVTYSIVYYPLAGALGIKFLAVLMVAAGVVSFAAVVRHEWEADAKWSIRAFALVWAMLVVSAAYPFMLGSVFALLALSSLQRNRRWPFAIFALLTLGSSPLAFILLVVVLAGAALAQREERGALVAPAAAVAVVGLLELGLRRMFPGHGSYPFSWEEFVAASTFCVLGAALTWNVAGARLLRWMFVVYFAACAAAFAVSSPIGENIARLRVVGLPIAFLVLSLRHWRPRLLCVGALALALAWNLTPLAASFVHGVDDPAASAAYWAPTIAYLHRHVPPSYRVEAVDTIGHWPADFLARARIPLVRGWFRQEDFPLNRVLYEKPGRAAYVAWLRNLSVRYVVLSSAPPDYSARSEARLLRSGRSGLKVVFRSPTATIFAVPSPRPLITPPARILTLGYASIRIKVPLAGTYRLGITYAPYWHTIAGCVRPAPDGMTRLTVRRPGIVSLRFDVTATRALSAMLGVAPGPCR